MYATGGWVPLQLIINLILRLSEVKQFIEAAGGYKAAGDSGLPISHALMKPYKSAGALQVLLLFCIYSLFIESCLPIVIIFRSPLDMYVSM